HVLAISRLSGAEPSNRTVEASPSPIYAYVPGRWGSLRIDLVNPAAEPAELVCTTYVEDDPSLQYGRRVWLPAQSRVRISHLIRVPPKKNDEKFVELRSFVLDPQQATETLVSQGSGALQSPGSLRYAGRSMVTM